MANNMTIAVLSGKGGAGKTFVSVNLAKALANALGDKSVSYCDCDVEEPNGFLFFGDREDEESISVSVKNPSFDLEKCVSCRECVNKCAFNAIAFIKNKPKLMGGICHSCGACVLACGQNAVSEVDREIGLLSKARQGRLSLVEGRLNLGEATGVSLIDSVIKEGQKSRVTILDCPPGSACSAMECVKNADYLLIVGEPTAYGVHDLEMVLELAKVFKAQNQGLKLGFVINKAEEESNILKDFLDENDLPLKEQIPFQRETASAISRGYLAYDSIASLREIFDRLARDIILEVGI